MAFWDDITSEQADRLYEKYGKSLEVKHWGEYIAIGLDGGFVFGPVEYDVAVEANKKFGPRHILYKIGPRVVGRL